MDAPLKAQPTFESVLAPATASVHTSASVPPVVSASDLSLATPLRSPVITPIVTSYRGRSVVSILSHAPVTASSEQLEAECKRLCVLKSPFLHPLLAVCASPVGFVSATYQSLADLTNNNIPDVWIIRIALEIAQALHVLHQASVVHGALVPQNVCVDTSSGIPHVALTGYGFVFTKKYDAAARAAFAPYMNRLVDDSSTVNEATDIHSLGEIIRWLSRSLEHPHPSPKAQSSELETTLTQLHAACTASEQKMTLGDVVKTLTKLLIWTSIAKPPHRGLWLAYTTLSYMTWSFFSSNILRTWSKQGMFVLQRSSCFLMLLRLISPSLNQ